MKTARIVSKRVDAQDIKIYLEDVDGKDVDITDYVMGCTVTLAPGELVMATMEIPAHIELSAELKEFFQTSIMSTRPACPHCGLATLTGNCTAVLPSGYLTACSNTECHRNVYLDETLPEIISDFPEAKP